MFFFLEVGLQIPVEDQIAKEIVDASVKIHKALGPGLFESVYESVLSYELIKRGHSVERQVTIPVRYEGLVFEIGFKADIIVDNKVIVELKSVQALQPVHAKQLLTYVRLAEKRLGILLNFGERMMKEGIRRMANNLPE